MQTALVPFHGHKLLTLRDAAGGIRVAMRPIVEALGLDWSGQRQRIMRHDVLKTCVGVMKTTLPGDDQEREVVTLPLGMLSGWLVGVQLSRVKPHLRELLLAYKRESYDALYRYWVQGKAENPRAAGGDDFKVQNQFVRMCRAYDAAKVPEIKRSIAKLVVEAALNAGIEPPNLDEPEADPRVKAFFDALAALENQGTLLNHSRKRGVLAVSMNEAAALLHKVGMRVDDDLRRSLRACAAPRFVGIKNVNSRIADRTVHCWLFEVEASTLH